MPHLRCSFHNVTLNKSRVNEVHSAFVWCRLRGSESMFASKLSVFKTHCCKPYQMLTHLRGSSREDCTKQIESELCSLSIYLVPVAGVEPARYRYHWILSPARLPIPSHRHFSDNENIITQFCPKIKSFFNFILYNFII